MTRVSSIKVGVRSRPLGYNELRDGCQSCVGFPGGDEVIIGGTKQFSFDHVFGDQCSQLEIYEGSVKEMVNNLFLGYNVTVLAYGQTGSGKTYTMGTNCSGSIVTTDTGIIPRTVYDIYKNLEGMRETCEITVKTSFIEVYNEEIFDLLSLNKEIRTIREENQDVKIPGLIEENANSVDDIFRCLSKGSDNRAVGSTAMNETSSRSHAIFTMYFSIVPKPGVLNVDSITSKLHLVDLAGSERCSKTGATGDRFKEGVNINRGLLALGNVISSLVERDRFKDRTKHIPYRESKLTRLLQDSLGGNTKTLMLACISPADSNFEETATTLNYAARARMIQNKAVINKVNSAQSEIFQLQAQVNALKAQLKDSGTVSSIQPSSLIQTNHICELNAKVVLMQRERLQILEEFDEEMAKKDELLKRLWEKLIREDSEKDDVYDDLDRFIQDISTKEEQEDIYIEDDKKGDVTEDENAETTVRRSDYLKCLREELETKEKRLENTEEDLKILQHYEEKNRELEQRIKELEEEKTRKSHNSRSEEVESKLKDARRQLLELQNLKKEKDRKTEEVNQLRQKIQELKSSIVKASKDMNKEKASFKKMAADKEKQYKLLVNKDRQLQSQMERQAVQHAKETAVLKRKLESGAANEKRLKELLENRKNFSMNRITRDNVNKNINSQVKLWIRQSLDQAAEVCETRQRVNKLIEKRRKLSEELLVLDDVIDNEIKCQIEQDIKNINDCLSLQQANLTDSNHEMQVVANWNQLRNINECRVAIKFMFKQLVEERVSNVMNDMEMQDLKAHNVEIDESNVSLKSDIENLKSQMEKFLQQKTKRRRTTLSTAPKDISRKKRPLDSVWSDVDSSSIISRKSSRQSSTCRCKGTCKPSRCGCMKSNAPCSKLCNCKGECTSADKHLPNIEEMDITYTGDDSDKENVFNTTFTKENDPNSTLCDRTFTNQNILNFTVQ